MLLLSHTSRAASSSCSPACFPSRLRPWWPGLVGLVAGLWVGFLAGLWVGLAPLVVSGEGVGVSWVEGLGLLAPFSLMSGEAVGVSGVGPAAGPAQSGAAQQTGGKRRRASGKPANAAKPQVRVVDSACAHPYTHTAKPGRPRTSSLGEQPAPRAGGAGLGRLLCGACERMVAHT